MGVADARHRRGVALPLVVLAIFVFTTILFAVARYQVHETRWLERSIDLERASLLADAGMARAVARMVARPYAKRWYGPAPYRTDDLLTDTTVTHAGRFDESSQDRDAAGPAGGGSGGASGGPMPVAHKLDPAGTYEVLVEDRLIQYDPASGRWLTENELQRVDGSAMLAYTDIFARGMVQGIAGPASALVFARVAIAPEVSYFSPSASAPELIKKVIRYHVYTDPAVARVPYRVPGQDTQYIRQRISEDIARFHANFLRSRELADDLRQRASDPTWGAFPPSKYAFSQQEVLALFSGMHPVLSQPPFAYDAPEAFNLWVEQMLRLYQLSDLLGPNRGFVYAIDPSAVPSGASDTIARNIAQAFFGQSLDPIDPRFLWGSNNPVTNGNDLLDLQKSKNVESNPPADYARDISSFRRDTFTARIIDGHLIPYPQGPSTPTTAARSYVDSIFASSFQSQSPPIPMTQIVSLMRGEAQRINAMVGQDLVDPNTYVHAQQVVDRMPIDMISQTNTPQGPSYHALPVAELMKLYYKYIESEATFSGGSVQGGLGGLPPLGPGAPAPGGPGTGPTITPGTGPGTGPGSGPGGGPPGSVLPPPISADAPRESPDPPPPPAPGQRPGSGPGSGPGTGPGSGPGGGPGSGGSPSSPVVGPSTIGGSAAGL